MLENKEFRKKISLILIQTIIVLTGAILASWFLIQKINQKRKALSEKQIMIQVLQQKREVGITFLEDYKKIEPYLDKIKSALPPQDNLVPFVLTLENLANQTQNQQSLRFEKSEPFQVEQYTLNKVSYKIVLTGNYNSFLDYLQKFEKIPYLTKINSFDLISSQGVDVLSQITIEGEVYAR